MFRQKLLSLQKNRHIDTDTYQHKNTRICAILSKISSKHVPKYIVYTARSNATHIYMKPNSMYS